MTEWQPIETAPKDGLGHVLLWNGKRVFLGWHNDDEGWHNSTNQDCDDYPEQPQPSHWTPLPAPPVGDPAHDATSDRDALWQIAQWSDAYPLKVFPEPTPDQWTKMAELLKGAGMTLDSFSASNMRHVVDGVGKIAKDALAATEP